MKESTKFTYFIFGILFCLLILGAVGIYLYDQIDITIVVVINKLNQTIRGLTV